MNKLFKFFLTSAAISAALVGAVSCQKDFAPDIESLNKKVAELTQKLNDLQTKIDAGEVVTNVTTTAGGITVTTNKGTYNIVNGKDGKDGTNGTNGTNGKDGKDGKDGSVVTIGDNGNWFIDGKDTGLAAAGKNGKDGTARTVRTARMVRMVRTVRTARMASTMSRTPRPVSSPSTPGMPPRASMSLPRPRSLS